MRTMWQLGYVMSGVALVILAGCSGAGSSASGPFASGQAGSGSTSPQSLDRQSLPSSTSVLPPAMRQPVHTGVSARTFISPAINAPGGANLFVSDDLNNIVHIYNVAGQLTGTIGGFLEPQGMAVDKSGNLYVADTENNRIQVYVPPYNGTPTTLNDPAGHPAGVAVDANGNVAATNFGATFGSGSVSFYPKGATNPTSTVSNPTFFTVFFGAFDTRGDLYIDGVNSNNTTVVGVVVGGIKGKTISTLTTNNTIKFPGGVQVTNNGLIAYEDQLGFNIYAYEPPNRKTGSLGSPVATTPLGGSTDAVTFAFTPRNKSAITIDGYAGTVNLYAYPAGGAPLRTLDVNTDIIGIATNPAQMP